MDSLPLLGKRTLVTGAGKGIGRGIALSLARAGADLCLHYRSDRSEAESLKTEVEQLGRQAHIIQADLAESKAREGLFSGIDELWGGMDIAVNNAGWDPGDVPFEHIDEALYEQLTDINIKSVLFSCLREIDLMRQDGGSIINIGSVQQETSVPGRTLYAMSKGAIHSMTGQLALECGPLGIRINNIAPGYIEVARMSDNPEYERESVAAGIPMRRVGCPRDVGDMAVYLASSAATFMTGQTLTLDGGVSRKLARNS